MDGVGSRSLRTCVAIVLVVVGLTACSPDDQRISRYAPFSGNPRVSAHPSSGLLM
jgi:hypothetical protein